MFTFKKKQIEVEGQLLDLVEISAGGYRKFTKTVQQNPDDEMLQMGTLLSVGVEQFKGKTVDQVLDLLTVQAISDIVPQIIELSGMDDKADEAEEPKKS